MYIINDVSIDHGGLYLCSTSAALSYKLFIIIIISRGELKPRCKPFSRVLLICLSLHFLNPYRASPAETHRQEAGTHGDPPGEPAPARPAAGAPAEGAGRSQKPAATHTR